MHPDQKRWDEKFRRRLRDGREPSSPEWVDPIVREWDSGPVLDLAGGRRGISGSVSEDVYFLLADISRVALRDARERITRNPDTRGLVQADLETEYPFGQIRALYGVFFFYSPFLYGQIARWARPGSQVLVETYCGRGDSAPINEQYCLAPGELRDYFADWEQPVYREGGEGHPDTVRLWAKKPMSGESN